MRDHTNTERAFYWSNRAWYAKANYITNSEITFGLYGKEGSGGTTGEMVMRWHDLGGKWTARLECFEDAWSALASFTDLIQALGQHDSEEIDETGFVNLLKLCGFKDLTPYKNPHEGENCPTCGREIAK